MHTRIIHIFILLFSICSPTSLFAQYDTPLLADDLKIYDDKNIDTISIFGNVCQRCTQSYINSYYLVYSSEENAEVRVLDYEIDDNSAFKIRDSTFKCPDCKYITSFVSQNYSILNLCLPHAGGISGKQEGDHIVFSPNPRQGPSHYYGIYMSKKLYHVTMVDYERINHIIDNNFICWAFVNLLRNQFK